MGMDVGPAGLRHEDRQAVLKSRTQDLRVKSGSSGYNLGT